uniref:K+ potassium transporter integral membrane domain-containing protein n=1 Tax=Ananas comosus var. bracteatus TaxID=296719 RepID=A0A6V7NQF3_ANACO|nr:unnamed protein product [Ananas comosus var. bracteatus]
MAKEVDGDEITQQEESLGTQRSLRRKLRYMDSFHLEAGKVSNINSHDGKDGWIRTLHLAFQSIGIVYGDMGTSPLYVYESTFPDGITVDDDLYGVLSLIIYTLLLLSLLKYVFIVLWANDNGDGGSFALYSLISRYAKVSLIPNQQAEDAMVSNYKPQTPSTRMRRAQWLKQKLEGSVRVQVALFLITILATSMVIGDGVLTPCISGKVVIISVVILLLVFAIQRLGTDKVGYCFAPIIFVWFVLIGGIGVYNLFKYDVSVLRAFNPKYIVNYFKRNGKQGWLSSVVLSFASQVILAKFNLSELYV